MKFTYKTKGTCSRSIDIEVDGSTIKNVSFNGGCSGNTQGVSILVKGQDIDSVIGKLSSINCGMRGTSCPDQLAKALLEYKNQYMD